MFNFDPSIELIEKQTGRKPLGYRAPAFSVTQESWWAGPILAEAGFKYSSSVFPIAGRRYGVPDAPRFPHKWTECDLMEFPLTTARLLGKNLPVCGGGYFRLLPWTILGRAIRQVNGQGHPVVVYMHPYEMDVYEVADLKRQGYPISRKVKLMQSLFRSRIYPRLDRMFRAFRFGTMAEVLNIE